MMNLLGSKRIIAIIPARSGSKGLPDKNIRILAGKPLIAHTIEAALKSELFAKVVVSTDSEVYRKIAIDSGAEAPFLRPTELSEDSSNLSGAILHALDFYRKQNEFFDYILLLQPTSPFRTSQHIMESVRRYHESSRHADETLVSVVKAPSKARWLMEQNDSYVQFCFDIDGQNTQRQKLEALYLPNGAIYMAPVQGFNGNFYSAKTIFYEMDEVSSIDVDTIEDFKRAEVLGRVFKV